MLRDFIRPHLMIDSFEQIDLEKIWAQGVRGIILDLDNTITFWQENEVRPEAHRFIAKSRQHNFKLCLLSNSSKKRVRTIAALYGIPFIAPAYKPGKKSFEEAAGVMKLASREIMVIGDQLFTDILGGKRAGCYTTLIKPLNTKEFIGTKIARIMERIYFRFFMSRNDN